MDLQEIEYYHNRGLMPDWVYYQVNGKSAEENLEAQRRKMYDKFKAAELEKQQQKELEKQVEEMVEKALDDVLGDLLKSFK